MPLGLGGSQRAIAALCGGETPCEVRAARGRILGEITKSRSMLGFRAMMMALWHGEDVPQSAK